MPDVPEHIPGGWNSGCRCERCHELRLASRRRNRASRLARSKVKPLMAGNDPRHGTLNGYTNMNCRCGYCRQAMRTYTRAARKAVSQEG